MVSLSMRQCFYSLIVSKVAYSECMVLCPLSCVLHPSGNPILCSVQLEPKVSLVLSLAIPSYSGCFSVARLTSGEDGVSDIQFEPQHEVLIPLDVDQYLLFMVMVPSGADGKSPHCNSALRAWAL